MLLKTASLTSAVLAAICNKATQASFMSEYTHRTSRSPSDRSEGSHLEVRWVYTDFGGMGTYLCRQCGLALFHSGTFIEE